MARFVVVETRGDRVRARVTSPASPSPTRAFCRGPSWRMRSMYLELEMGEALGGIAELASCAEPRLAGDNALSLAPRTRFDDRCVHLARGTCSSQLRVALEFGVERAGEWTHRVIVSSKPATYGVFDPLPCPAVPAKFQSGYLRIFPNKGGSKP